MKKFQFFKELKSMQPCVRQAKVHIINKLIRAAKELREKKGSDEQKVKNSKKADKFIENVKSIRKLKDKETAIKCLQNTLNFKDVLSDPSSSIEVQALLRVYEHPKVKSKVEEIRSEWGNWKNELPILLGSNPEKRKRPQKKLITQKESGEENIESVPEATEIHVAEKPWQEKKKKKKTEHTKAQPSSPVASELEKKPLEVAPKRQGALEIRKLNLESQDEDHDLPSLEEKEASEDSSSDQELPTTDKSRDLFCMRGERVDGDKPVGRNFRGGLHSGRGRARDRKFPTRPDWQNRRGRGRSDTFPARKPLQQYQHSPKAGQWQQSIKKREFTSSKGTHEKTASAETLHPSWEAKRKQREQESAVVSFQGKKIKFDDD